VATSEVSFKCTEDTTGNVGSVDGADGRAAADDEE
jgi:hypothetical protein